MKQHSLKVTLDGETAVSCTIPELPENKRAFARMLMQFAWDLNEQAVAEEHNKPLEGIIIPRLNGNG